MTDPMRGRLRAGLAVAIAAQLTAGAIVAAGRPAQPVSSAQLESAGDPLPRVERAKTAKGSEKGRGKTAAQRAVGAHLPVDDLAGGQDFEDLDWPPASNPDPDFPLTIKVVPGCGSAGTAMRARVRTLPSTWIALIVIYRDGKPRETWYTGQVGKDGAFSFPWVVPPDAPVGPGRVAITATHDDRDQAASATAPFRIAAIGGCS